MYIYNGGHSAKDGTPSFTLHLSLSIFSEWLAFASDELNAACTIKNSLNIGDMVKFR